MQKLSHVVAAVLLSALVFVPLSFGASGLGSGGLNGFPPAPAVSNADITPNSVTTQVASGSSAVVLQQGSYLTWGSSQQIRATGSAFEFSTVPITPGSDQEINLGSTSKKFSSLYVYEPNVYGNYHIGTAVWVSATAPTIANGCTGEAMTWNNGTGLFQFDVGTSCSGVSTTTITMPAVAHTWHCDCSNATAAGLVRRVEWKSGTTTTAVIQSVSETTGLAVDFTDGDDILCSCRGG